MADRGLHELGEQRSITARYFWLWIALAFVVGLVPGIAGLLWYRTTTTSYNARLVLLRKEAAAQNAKLTAENEKLVTELASAQSASQAGSSGQESGAATGTVPAPKPGEVTFVSRSVEPSAAAPAATIALTTVIAGKATDAYMQVKSEAGSVSKIWQLHKGATNGNAQTWSRTDAVAPKAAGDYVVFSWALVGTKKFTMPGAGLLTVK